MRNYRTVVLFKHPSSGRLQFVRFPSGSICGPEVLPELAVLADSAPDQLFIHPGLLKKEMAEQLGISDDALVLLSEFRMYLEVPERYAVNGLLPIFLLAIADKDAPNLPAEYSWIEMPESFDLPYLEREILREAYVFSMS